MAIYQEEVCTQKQEHLLDNLLKLDLEVTWEVSDIRYKIHIDGSDATPNNSQSIVVNIRPLNT